MAAFEDNPETYGRLDWLLLQNGFVTLYWRSEILHGDLEWLRQHQYKVIDLNAGEWVDASSLHRSLACAFQFPSYYGGNLDALNDCLADVTIPEDGGMVLLLRSFDRFSSRDCSTAMSLLDILVDRCRNAALFGRR